MFKLYISSKTVKDLDSKLEQKHLLHLCVLCQAVCGMEKYGSGDFTDFSQKSGFAGTSTVLAWFHILLGNMQMKNVIC